MQTIENVRVKPSNYGAVAQMGPANGDYMGAYFSGPTPLIFTVEKVPSNKSKSNSGSGSNSAEASVEPKMPIAAPATELAQQNKGQDNKQE